MSHIRNIVAASVIIAGAAILCSCKGRTAENMEPKGETVEVNVETVDINPPTNSPAASDSVAPAEAALPDSASTEATI